jgi:hypothetical protein
MGRNYYEIDTPEGAFELLESLENTFKAEGYKPRAVKQKALEFLHRRLMAFFIHEGEVNAIRNLLDCPPTPMLTDEEAEELKRY